MLTTFIIFLTLIITGSIIVGIIQSDNADFAGLHVLAILIVLIFSIAFITHINENEKNIDSKTLLKPSIKIETIKNDSNIIKSDTTYIYKFKNNN